MFTLLKSAGNLYQIRATDVKPSITKISTVLDLYTKFTTHFTEKTSSYHNSALFAYQINSR